MNRIQAALARVDKQIEGIELRPRSMGSHPESLETQMRQALAMRQLLWGYKQLDLNWYMVFFTHQLNGEPSNLPLWAILQREGMIDQLPRLLGDFARWVAREFPPKTRKARR